MRALEAVNSTPPEGGGERIPMPDPAVDVVCTTGWSGSV
jgi:hypothetical protein